LDEVEIQPIEGTECCVHIDVENTKLR